MGLRFPAPDPVGLSSATAHVPCQNSWRGGGHCSCNTAATAEMLELCVCVILLLPVSHPKEPSFDFVSFFFNLKKFFLHKV